MRSPVAPPPPPPPSRQTVVVRTPWGWDFRVVDAPGGPARLEEPPPEPPRRHRGRWVAAVAVVATIAGVVAVRTLGAPAPKPAARATVSATAPAQAIVPAATPSPGTPSPVPTEPPTAAPTPAPTDTPAQTPLPPPPAPHTSGTLLLGGAITSAGGRTTEQCVGGASGSGFCQWLVTVPAGSLVTLDLHAGAGPSLQLEVTSPDGTQQLFDERSASGTIRAALPNVPGPVLVTVSLAGTSRVQFSVTVGVS